MERTLDTVLRSIGNPSIASGMVSRSPSPSAGAGGRASTQAATQALLSETESPTSPPPTYQQPSTHPPGSPKLHSLPDNSLNPLGLLAEASLANRRAQASQANKSVDRTSSMARPPQAMGVASDTYFKPGKSDSAMNDPVKIEPLYLGPMTILPLRRLFIERQIQPEMLSFVPTEEVVALFNMYVFVL